MAPRKSCVMCVGGEEGVGVFVRRQGGSKGRLVKQEQCLM